MSELEIDQQLVDAIDKGRVVLFLGAGFGLAPSTSGERETLDGRGLAAHVASAFQGSIPAEIDAESWRLDDLVALLERRLSIARPAIEAVIRDHLRSSAELQTLESYVLLRRLLSARPDLFPHIVTTNWDHGIEASLDGLPNVSVRSVIADNDLFQPIGSANDLLVYKIHGDIERPDVRLIISRPDYDTYERERPLLVERLRGLFAQRQLVLLGYSAADENFRRLIRSLQFDLGDRFAGGCIVVPQLRDQDELWCSDANIRHIPATAQDFLKAVARRLCIVRLGATGRAPVTVGHPRSEIFELDQGLKKLASEIRKIHNLKEVWVSRTPAGSHPNKRLAETVLLFLADRCSEARSLTLGTGRTIESVAAELWPTMFTNTIRIRSSIVIAGDSLGYAEPARIVDSAVAQLGEGRALATTMRLPSIEDMDPTGAAALSELADQYLQAALGADVILGSARPFDWFGGETLYGRTIPFDRQFRATRAQLESTMRELEVAAIHHMAVVNQAGEDVTEVVRTRLTESNWTPIHPRVSDLALAAGSRRRVVVVAAGAEKSDAVRALLHAGALNTLIVDHDLAMELIR